jgi:AcrR family transcriptional regulator
MPFVKAAVRLFAEKGFQGTSVRDIIVKARVNQAAINYHFKSKDGLYLEVLNAFETLTEQAGFDPEKSRRFRARKLCERSCASNCGRSYSATR